MEIDTVGKWLFGIGMLGVSGLIVTGAFCINILLGFLALFALIAFVGYEILDSQ